MVGIYEGFFCYKGVILFCYGVISDFLSEFLIAIRILGISVSDFSYRLICQARLDLAIENYFASLAEEGLVPEIMLA